MQVKETDIDTGKIKEYRIFKKKVHNLIFSWSYHSGLLYKEEHTNRTGKPDLTLINIWSLLPGVMPGKLSFFQSLQIPYKSVYRNMNKEILEKLSLHSQTLNICLFCRPFIYFSSLKIAEDLNIK